MPNFITKILRKIFRKRHIYSCYFTCAQEDEQGESYIVSGVLTLTSTANPRNITHEYIENWLREDQGNDTIKLRSYYYQGKW